MAEIYCACDVASQIACATCRLGEIRNPVKCFRAPWPLFDEADLDAHGLDVLAKEILDGLADEDGIEIVGGVVYFNDDKPGDPGPGGKAQ